MKRELFLTIAACMQLLDCIGRDPHVLVVTDLKDRERMLVYILNHYKKSTGKNFVLESGINEAFALEGDKSNCIMDCDTDFPKKTLFRIAVSDEGANFLVAGDYVKNHPYGSDLFNAIVATEGNNDTYITIYGGKTICDYHFDGVRRVPRCRIYLDRTDPADVKSIESAISKVP